MKKVNLLILSVIFIAVTAFTVNMEKTAKKSDNPTIDKGTYVVDTKASTVKWVGRKIAYSHHGTLELASGSLVFEKNGLTGGLFTFDMGTIKDLDLEDTGKNAKLVGHLKSKDFFYVEEFPTSNFKITEVKAGAEDNQFTISGDLTIKGITHPLTFDAMVKEVDGTIKASANMKFDRSKYDVRFQSGTFFENLGDKAIYDDIEMEVVLVAKIDDGMATQ